MDKIYKRNRRKKSIRKKISGTSERPRMSIHKSNRNLFIQIVDDVEGKTICGISTLSKVLKDRLSSNTCKNIKSAELIGQEIARVAVDKGVTKIAFDRAGYKYHGVVKTIADSARKNGLQF